MQKVEQFIIVVQENDLVAFEALYAGEVIIAVHEDLNDADQTVKVVEISTKLTDKKTGKKTATAGTETELVDTVSYKGLTKGKTYTVKGELYDKETGKKTGVKASAEFTAKGSKGKVKLTFKLDTNKYAGKKLVAFERLYDEDGQKIAVHEDIKDKDQTIDMPPAENPPTDKTTTTTSGTPDKSTLPNAKTGDRPFFPYVLMIVFAGLLIFFFRKRRFV